MRSRAGTLTRGKLPRLEATATNWPRGSNGAELLERGVSASKRSDLWLVIQPLEKPAVEQGATYFYVGFGSANVMASSPSIFLAPQCSVALAALEHQTSRWLLGPRSRSALAKKVDELEISRGTGAASQRIESFSACRRFARPKPIQSPFAAPLGTGFGAIRPAR
jgi:hypothetical protein